MKLRRSGPVEALNQEQLVQTIETLKSAKPKWIQRQVGRALFRAGQYQEAIDWHRGHSLDGIEPECTVAMALHRLGQQKEAEEMLRATKRREFSQLSELNLPLWFVGFVLIDEANRLITGVPLANDPEWQAVREKLDRAAAACKPETADYDLALLLQPRDPRLWVMRAERNADLAQWEEAEHDFESAMALDRKSLYASLCFARYCLRRDRFEQSRNAYSKLLNLDHAGSLRTEVLTDLEQNDRLFVALLELRERDISLWRARGTSLCGQRRWKDAVAVWKHLLQLMPDDWLLHRDLAMLHAGAGDQAGFAQACAAMMTGSADAVPPLTAWYSSIMPGSGIEPDTVVAMARRFSDADPTDAAARSTVGAALLRAARYQEALEELEFAARLSESDESPNGTPAAYMWFLMAIAHGRMGNTADARLWQGNAQQWVEDHVGSHQLSLWTRQLTIQLFAAEAQLVLGQVASATE